MKPIYTVNLYALRLCNGKQHLIFFFIICIYVFLSQSKYTFLLKVKHIIILLKSHRVEIGEDRKLNGMRFAKHLFKGGPGNHFLKLFSLLHNRMWEFLIHTVGELMDWTLHRACLCSKTTQIASSVSGAGMNPQFCKMGTFFLNCTCKYKYLFYCFSCSKYAKLKWETL